MEPWLRKRCSSQSEMLLLEVLDVELLVKLVAVDVMLVTCRKNAMPSKDFFIDLISFFHKTNINRVLDATNLCVQQTSFPASPILFLFKLYDCTSLCLF